MKQETENIKKVKKTVENTIKEHKLAAENMHIVLGLSGGPDSVCLFDVLQRLSDDLDMRLTLHPVHINHKFRPGAAEEDQLYVEQLCESRGIKCNSFVFDCNEIARSLKLTSEEAGRKVRYESFSKVASEIEESGVDRSKIAIAVAQNANDQCETVLFRILRGTGTDGLSGIAYERQDESGYRIIRPLLDVYRNDIEAYCESAELNPRIDHTNEEAVYTRNKIRLELLPYLRENFNDNIVATVNRLAKIASEDSEYLNGEAQKIYDGACAWERETLTAETSIDRISGADICEAAVFTEPLDNIHAALRYRIYNIALAKVGLHDNISRAHIEAIENVRISQNPSASVNVGGGFIVAKAYDKLIFRANSADTEICSHHIGSLVNQSAAYSGGWLLSVIKYDELKEKIKAAADSGNIYGAFGGDAAEYYEKLEIRTRKNGDYITLKGGKKKIQDFFVDCKVPRLYRDEIRLLALGNRILWIMPSPFFANEAYRLKGRFSADFAVDSERDNNIIFLENKRNL